MMCFLRLASFVDLSQLMLLLDIEVLLVLVLVLVLVQEFFQKLYNRLVSNESKRQIYKLLFFPCVSWFKRVWIGDK